MYLYPCKTQGKCRENMFTAQGWTIPLTAPKNGTVQVYVDTKFGFQKHVGHYKCCTQCHAPLNQVEANKANRLHGYTLDNDKPDDDFLEVLNGF